MDDDSTFRWILLAGMLVVGPIGAYHRRRAHGKGEKLDRWQEGAFLLFSIRVLAIPVLASWILFMIEPSWMAWSSVPVPSWLRWAGVGMGVIFGVFLTWTYRHLGTNITDTVVTRQHHTLVTTGPYRWVRHPFYVAIAMGVVVNALVMANWFALVCGVLLVTLLAIRVRKEEAKLIERFGDDYRAYMQKTGRFLPISW